MHLFCFLCWICAFILSVATRATPILPVEDPVVARSPNYKFEELTLTWAEDNPNGNSRNVIKINGQMPGPALIFDENDLVEVRVSNLQQPA